MKKLILFFLAVASIVSCNKVGNNEYVIEGNGNGLKDGLNVYLQQQDSTGALVQMDTVQIKKGKFTFEGKIAEPGLTFIEIDSATSKIPFILEEGKITIEVNKDTIYKSIVGGTYSNEQLVLYAKSTEKVQEKVRQFQEVNMSKIQAAQMTGDTVTMNALTKEYQVYQNEFKELSLKHVDEHPKSYISLLFIKQFLNDPSFDLARATKMYENLDPVLKSTREGKSIKKTLDGIKTAEKKNDTNDSSAVEVGSIAPDFSALNPEGTNTSLKSALGKLTLVDFWASWCGPCRKENPNVVALYKEYHPKGLNIIGISLDEKADKWKEAIAKDQLNWIHISNLKGWNDPIAKRYSVESIPATFLLDEKGVVIARDLRGDELRAKVASILK
jgi:thiol-disulfide isomerase/thioredoxin